jgi:hypothetical protein
MGDELRCPHGDLFARLVEGRIEVRCRSTRCKEPGTVVFHYYDPSTGEFIETKRYRDPVSASSKQEA